MLGPSADPAADRGLESVTNAEVQTVWLAGPFMAKELHDRHAFWLPARRFGVRQGNKLRAIDDYSIIGHNSACHVPDKADMERVDSTAAICHTFLAAQGAGDDTYRLDFSDVTIIAGDIHLDLTDGSAKDLAGKTWDVASAYRQLARNLSDAGLSEVGVWLPSLGRAGFLEQRAMPFGGVASVHFWIWVSRFLHTLLLRGLYILATHRVDDYSIVELLRKAASADERFFVMLSWPTKAPDTFARTFTPSGVVFDFRESRMGVIIVANKEKRVLELKDGVEELLAGGALTPARAWELRGRIFFARVQVFSRMGAQAVLTLGRAAVACSPSPAVVQAAVGASASLACMLVRAWSPTVLVSPVSGICRWSGLGAFSPSQVVGLYFSAVLCRRPLCRCGRGATWIR